MSLFTSFNAGVSGLQSSQAGLNTTAHNLANTKTQGYTRQQNINKDTYYQTIKTTTNSTLQVGYGTTVATIRQIRNEFLDKEYRKEVSRQTFYEVQYNTATEIEDILGETEGVEFNDVLSDIWQTVQDLSTNPESITNRKLFITQAESFLEKAQNVYSALKSYQVNLNSQIESQVTSINKIADQIAELNTKISAAEASGLENANDYRDARNLLLDQLAEYTNYDYYEDSTGQVNVRINNAPLVDESRSYHMACKNIKNQKYDEATGTYTDIESSPMYTVVWEKNGYGEVYDINRAYSQEEETDMGSLLGILTARGKNVGVYTDIVQNPTSYELENYNNTTGNCLLEKVEAQFDLLIHKIVTAVNDAFAPNVDADLTGVTGTDANGKAMPALTNAKVLDANNCLVGADDDETIGTEVFTRKGQGSRYTVYTVNGPVTTTDENGNTITLTKENVAADGTKTYSLYVYNEEDADDKNTLYTLQNMEVNSSLKENYSYLPVKGNPATGNYGTYLQTPYENILASWRKEDTALDPNALSKYGADGFYDAMVGNLATQGSVWKSIMENQTKETESIEDKRQQIAGVSTEEEMTSLLMYQHAYNAASRYITTVDAMLQHLIERLG
jgi:flagellar hook-associated protein 1 FlgK